MLQVVSTIYKGDGENFNIIEKAICFVQRLVWYEWLTPLLGTNSWLFLKNITYSLELHASTHYYSQYMWTVYYISL